MVEHPARRSDDDLGAALQLFDLRANRLAAVEGHAVDPPAMGQFDALLRGPARPARGSEPGSGPADPLFLLRVEPLENRNGERGRFAGAGAGLAQHVDSGQGAGNQAGLNGGRPKIFDLASAESITSERPRSEKLASEGVSGGAALTSDSDTSKWEILDTLREGECKRTDFDGLTLAGDREFGQWRCSG